MGASDLVPIERHGDETMQPIDPHVLVHFVAACQVAGVTVTGLDSSDLRALIQRLSRLSIPDAVKSLSKEAP
jgi:hypothetical protein